MLKLTSTIEHLEAWKACSHARACREALGALTLTDDQNANWRAFERAVDRLALNAPATYEVRGVDSICESHLIILHEMLWKCLDEGSPEAHRTGYLWHTANSPAWCNGPQDAYRVCGHLADLVGRWHAAGCPDLMRRYPGT
jgi:hypothetical protein